MRGSDLIDIMKAYRFHDHWLNFVESDDVRSKLHVGHSTFNLETPIRISKREEPGKHLFETILNARVPLLRFTGQYDGIVPYQSSVHTLHTLDWYDQQCLTTTRFRRKQVWHEGKLVGYYRQCGILWEMIYLRVSHVVQYFVPRPLWTFINLFIQERERKKGAIFNPQLGFN